jgi:hypothetical protein
VKPGHGTPTNDSNTQKILSELEALTKRFDALETQLAELTDALRRANAFSEAEAARMRHFFNMPSSGPGERE